MNWQNVVSREFKLVLKKKKFSGDEERLKRKAQAFWKDLQQITKQVAETTEGELATINNMREIRFYDTKAFTLGNAGYVFRERKELPEGKHEATLKFRHADRYIAQDRNMQLPKKIKAKIKFEADIKMPFITLYSFSATQPLAAKETLSTLNDAVRLYPSLRAELGKFSKLEKLQPVNKVAVQEVVITGTEINICKRPLVNAECALIVWYEKEAFKKDPVIVEFSFRYGNKQEQYDRKSAQKAYDLFLMIQEQLKPWIAKESTTKTAFLFDK